MLKLPVSPDVASRLLRKLEERKRWRELGGIGSGNFGHAGRPGQIGGSTPDYRGRASMPGSSGPKGDFTGGVYGVTPDSLDVRPDGMAVFHTSPDEFVEGKPEFDAYFGDSEFLAAFPHEFGSNTYKVELPKSLPIIDLNKSTHDTREFMAQMAERTWPDDKAYAELLRSGKADADAMNDFYDSWTDKSNALAVLKQLPRLAGVKYQNEYILPKKTIRQLPGEKMRTAEALATLGGQGSGNFGHAGRPGEVGGSAPASGGLTAYRELKSDWTEVNEQMFQAVRSGVDPRSEEMKQLLEEEKRLARQMHTMSIDTGGPSDIGQPGEPYDVIIVGAGPSGLAASQKAAHEGLDVLVVEKTDSPGGAPKRTSLIENVVGYPTGVTGEKLAADMYDQSLRMGAEHQFGIEAIGISHDPETGLKTIQFSDGTSKIARTVIVAGGVQFNKGRFIGSDSDNVITGDGERLADLTKGKPVVILGGANSAAQAARLAAIESSQVTLISRSPTTMSSKYREALESKSNVKIVEGASVTEFMNGKVTLDNGTAIDAEGVGVFFGGKPNTAWLGDQVRRDSKTGQIITNGGNETDIPGVFAVGDNRAGTVGYIGMAIGDGMYGTFGVHQYLDRLKKKPPTPVPTPIPTATPLRTGAVDKFLSIIDRAFALDERLPFFGAIDEYKQFEPKTLGGLGSGNFGHSGGKGGKGNPGGSSKKKSIPNFPRPTSEFQGVLEESGFDDFDQLPGDVFFHGTTTQALDSIKKNGLIPRGGKGADAWAQNYRPDAPPEMFSRPPAVFLTENPYSAWRMANLAKLVNPGSDAVVLEIELPDDALEDLDPDELFQRSWKSLNKIPPEWIKGQLTASGELRPLAAKGVVLYAVVLIKPDERALGGPGSGNFGHSGRPGEVGGSAPAGATVTGEDADKFKLHLANITPRLLAESTAKEVAIVKDEEAAAKIDDYLMKNYGFDLAGQAESIVDRDRRFVITTKPRAPETIARTIPDRFQSDEWQNANRYIGGDAEDNFATSISSLFEEHGFLFPVARMSNPAAFPMELIHETLHRWGWIK